MGGLGAVRWAGVLWLEKSDIKLISTHVVVEVEVELGVELGKDYTNTQVL